MGSFGKTMSGFSGVVIEEDGRGGAYGRRDPYAGQDQMTMQAPPQAGKGMGQPFEMAPQERPGVNVTNAHVDEFAFLHAVEPLTTTAGRRRWPPQDKRSADETRDYLLQLFFEQGFGQQAPQQDIPAPAAPTQTLDLASMLAQQREKTLGGIRYVYDKSEVLQPGSILRQQDSEVGANKDTVITVVDEILQKRIKAIMEERL